MQPLNWIVNRQAASSSCPDSALQLIPREVPGKVHRFHSQIPGFKTSPLKALRNMADMLSLGGIWVKDEAQRFNLTSFKVLGGTYAIYRHLKQRLGVQEDISFGDLTSPEVKKKLGKITFASATDGNHGRGVAWAADKLGHRSVIYVHKGTIESRIKAIENYGARVHIIKGTYDDAVEKIKEDVRKNNWQIISDTAWEGYEEIPRWVMQGYTTMFSETQQQLAGVGAERPTHVLVQAGVGSLAASVVAFYRGLLGEDAPKFIIVEPEKASCLFESVRIGDGKPYKFEGELDTIMAGLSCGRANPIAWKVLRDCAEVFVACSDYTAARGMRMFAVPLEGDPFIVSGESGAVTLGVLSFIMQRSALTPMREMLELDAKSQVLLINTEGNTDPDYFRRVVWEGAHAVPGSSDVSLSG